MEILKVITSAFTCVNENKRTLIKALSIPFLLFLLLDILSSLDISPITEFVLALLSLAVQTIYAITTHRILLLGPSSVSPWGISLWSKRETFFILYMIGLGLVAIPLILFTFIPVIGPALFFVLFAWIVGRLSLVFPGIAVDKGVSFKYSWQMTEKYQLLMSLVVILFPILLTVPVYLLEFIPNTFLLSSFISTFIVVFQVAALTKAYQLIMEDKPSQLVSEC